MRRKKEFTMFGAPVANVTASTNQASTSFQRTFTHNVVAATSYFVGKQNFDGSNYLKTVTNQ
jgi:hypothetical protein